MLANARKDHLIPLKLIDHFASLRSIAPCYKVQYLLFNMFAPMPMVIKNLKSAEQAQR